MVLKHIFVFHKDVPKNFIGARLDQSTKDMMLKTSPDSIIHGANMGPACVLSASGGSCRPKESHMLAPYTFLSESIRVIAVPYGTLSRWGTHKKYMHCVSIMQTAVFLLCCSPSLTPSICFYRIITEMYTYITTVICGFCKVAILWGRFNSQNDSTFYSWWILFWCFWHICSL